MADAILKRIVEDVYPPGLRIPAESDLAAEFGCGRSTIREALRHLSSLGVIRSRRGSGAVVLDYRLEGSSLALLIPWLEARRFVHPINIIAKELLRMRTHLVCEGARLAALYAKPEALTRCRDIIEDSRALEDDPHAHAENDVAFHRAIHASCDIPPAVWLSNALQQPFAELGKTFPPIAMVPDGYADRMHALVDRIEARNAEGAVQFLQEHLQQIDQIVMNIIEGGLA